MSEIEDRGCFIKEKARVVVSVAAGALVLALAVEALTLIGAPLASVFDVGAWGKRRIGIMWIAFMVLYAALRYFGVFSSLRAWAAKLVRERRAVLPRVLFFAGGFAAAGLLGVGAAQLASWAGLLGPSVAWGAFSFIVAGCVFLVCANRGRLASSPERVFVPLGIALGVLMAVLSPVQSVVSFDDQVHYDHALAVSYLSSPEYTKADAAMLALPHIEGDVYGHLSFSEDEYRSIIDELNGSGAEHSFTIDGFTSSMDYSTLQYISLGYIPNAVGLWLGRLLHLPFAAIFILGRISSVLFFFTLVYFGVKRLRSQKVLALAFAVLPAVIFISSCYSYDIWVTGWLMFGFLRYLSWLQNPQEKLTLREVLVVVASFLLGLGPKAIYFPIFFLLLFIPKTKFPSKVFATRYRIAVVGAALLVLSTFFLPFVMQGPGSGDARGGSDVSSSGQISFILEDPLRYVGILANSLFEYFSLENSESYTGLLGYMGVSSLGGLPLVTLLLIAVFDSGEENYPYALWRYRFAALALLCGTSALVASALYVSYTAVGADMIAGVQGRYLLPLLLPFLTLFLNSKIRNENARGRCNLVILLVTMAFVLECVIELIIGVYVG